VHSPTRTPAQTSPLFQTSGSRSPALRRGGLELDHVFRPSRGPKIKWRPYKLRKQFSAELWEQAGWLIDMTMDMTRGDIDECASAYVMIDKDGSPTGASPPDPDRAYCMVCRRRIWAYDDNTAFPTELGLDGDWIDVGGGACCREMFAIKRRQTVGEAGQVASINLFHYRRGVWPTSRVFIACGPVASCIPPGYVLDKCLVPPSLTRRDVTRERPRG
jgi:hypothetical protein